MQRHYLFRVLWLGLLFGVPAQGEPLQLRPASTIVAVPGGSYAIPCVADWNGDGRKDLIVGYRTVDKIALFLNIGTDANPVFGSPVNLQAGGQDIYVQGASSCGAPAPWVCDFDGDGRRDLLVGSGLNGSVWFFKNTNTDSAPQLVPGVQLQVGSGGFVVPGASRATPYMHDWDEDGLPDILCGSMDGNIYFFKNTNTVQNPIFAPGVALQAGGGALNLGSRSVARVFDWDGDRLKDVVCSSMYGVYWARNTNSNSNPILQGKVQIQAPVATGGLANISSSTRMRLDLVDWNNDGVTDLILGNADGSIYYYQGYHFGFTGVTALPDNTVALQWNSAPYLKYNILAGDTVTSIQEIVATNLPSGGIVTGYTNQADAGLRFFRVNVAQ